MFIPITALYAFQNACLNFYPGSAYLKKKNIKNNMCLCTWFSGMILICAQKGMSSKWDEYGMLYLFLHLYLLLARHTGYTEIAGKILLLLD